MEEAQDKAQETDQPAEVTPAENEVESSIEPASQPEAEAQPVSNPALDAAQARVAELETELAQVRQEANDNWTKFLRERAEMDNFRKRQERLLGDRVLQQKKALLNKQLEVMDNLDRAMIYQETMDRQGFQQTLRMVQWQMNELLTSEGLTPVPTVGEAFNPYMHEAIEAIESSDKPEGTILEEVRKGYTMSNEVMRPARVKVSIGAKAPEA